MKQFNFTITDQAAKKLDKLKERFNIPNNADAVEFLIDFAFSKIDEIEALVKKEAP